MFARRHTDTTRPAPEHEVAAGSLGGRGTVALATLCALALALALALTLALAGPPAAGAASTPPSWSAPVAVSEPGATVYDAHLAVDAAGDAAAIWMRGNGGGGYVAQVATRVAGGAWSAPTTLSGMGVPAAETAIAIDAKGDAVAVWEQYVGKEQVEVKTHAAGAPGWSGATTLSSPQREADDAQVAIDPQGQAIVAWLGDDAAGHEIVQASAEQGFADEWGAPISLSAPGADAEEVKLGMDAAGDAFAVWRRPGSGNVQIEGSERPAGGSWGSPSVLSPPGVNAIEPELAVDAEGDEAVIWDHFTSTNIAQVTTRRAGGLWSTPHDLTGEAENVFGQQVGLDAQGDVTAIWFETVGEDTVRSATETAGTGIWSAPTDLAPANPAEPDPSLAVDPAGDAVVTWNVGTTGHEAIQAAARKGQDGAWSLPTTISSPGTRSIDTETGIGATGAAVALWRNVGNGEGIVSSNYDPGIEELPAPGSSSAPASPGAGGSPTASPPSSTPTPAKTTCPKGKALRKVKVHPHAKGRKKSKTVTRCVKPSPHRKKHHRHSRQKAR
jgi:hypothetical protein